ncbi:hypothetical protein AAFF_G00348810 [Aldrovandia affinis]|uniref:Fibrinogen C-terminal domain-containing protein n=1 Tax=Aldrovandia affinis TaxID=143900 RepID=A0AAD7SJN2_9TELE|nr:hypothetical protein AAFF_G00348810 [Aldrovandia affinis]
MGHLYLLFCSLVLFSSAFSEEIVGPRGTRPVEHGFKASECATEKEWPVCTDDDWGTKCPSGCRIQGLLDQADQQLATKIDRIRKFLDENRKHYRSTDQVTKQTYDFLRDKLVTDSGNDNRYQTLAEQLRQRIVSIKVKIVAQLKLLQALKERVRDQVTEMKRLEVDIDMKLRTCKGSCASYTEYSVDRDTYVTLDKQVSQLEAISMQRIETVSSLRVMKSRTMKESSVPSIYKTGAVEEQKLDYFSDVDQSQLILEDTSSPSTISKASGTESITTKGVHTTTHTVSCTKTIKKVITQTKDGPKEEIEIVGGGPGCEHLESSKGLVHDVSLTGAGGMTDLFPDMGSFFNERSKGKSTTTGTVKWSPLGDDFGGFARGEVEEDRPDIHARGLKGTKDVQADYVGKDCVDILQKHASGAKSGLFKIKPEGSEDVVEVYCDQDTMLAGWVLVQQRMDGSVNFNRTWKDYRNGFGSVDQQGRGELWLGNKYLHLLTQAESMLRIELEDWEGRESYAEYSVRVGPEAKGYHLSVSGYQGDAGDALIRGQPNLGTFLSHANMNFSTYDRDSDKWEENCAEMYGGGWWYNNCQSANLNGMYYKGGQYDPGSNVPYEIENGVIWLPLKPADYSLKTVRMKVRSLAT